MPTKVFTSYSHDSQPHSQRVLALANQLRSHGVSRILAATTAALLKKLGVVVLRAREAVVYDWTDPSETRPKPNRIADSLADVTAPLLDLSQTQWLRTLNRLRDLRLIELTGPSASPAVEAHPLLRECFAEQVKAKLPPAPCPLSQSRDIIRVGNRAELSFE